MERWRVIDTGLRPAAQNVALNRALLEARRAEEIPSTLRFLRYAPCALLGCHQSAEQEVNIDYCAANRIVIQRRMTGGAAVFLDENQIGWELYLHRRDVGAADIRAVSKRICHAAATATSALGMDARFRPPADIEVDGRRVAEAATLLDGEALLFQGMLFVDVDVEKTLRVLRIPASGLSDAVLACARDRVSSLTELMGRKPDAALIKRYLAEAFESEFDVEFTEGELTLSEHQRYRAALSETETAGWVNLVASPASAVHVLEGVRECAGGVLRASLIFHLPTRTIRRIWFTRDPPVQPRRIMADLEATLHEVPLERLARNVERFFAGHPQVLCSLAPADFIDVVQLALRQTILTKNA
jgi:lipoate---protein ligase